MSLTVIRFGPYRLFFFSREESRVHVHIQSSDGEAKFWIEPEFILANQVGFNKKQLKELQILVEENRHAIRDAWKKHFGSD